MRLVLILFLLLVSALSGSAGAQEAPPGALDLDYPELVMTATDHAFDIAGPVTAGPTLVTMVNDGAEPHHAQLMRLNEGRTFDEVGAALGQAPEAIFGLGQFVGGPGATGPGGQSQVILDLEPGLYVALCFIASPDGVPHLAKGMVQSFEVTATDAAPAAAPAADVSISMLDFAFDMPSQVTAGPQIWEIVNDGAAPHEIGLLKLAPGVTPEGVFGMIGAFSAASPETGHGHDAAPASPAAGAPGASGPPPFTSVGGMQGLASGLSGWVVLDLEPGTYVAVCFIPDPATGQTHVALGMVAAFTVE